MASSFVPDGLFTYYRRVSSQLWLDLRPRMGKHLARLGATMVGIFALAYWRVNPNAQSLTRIKAAALWSAVVLPLYLLLYGIRSPWKIHNASLADQSGLEDKVLDLESRLADAKAMIGRPEVVLRFSEATQREPVVDGRTMTTFGRESEFIARNGSKSDAYGVYIEPITIGVFTIQSRIPLDVFSGQEVRLDYIVSYEKDGVSCGNLEYRHNLRPLLDTVFAEAGYGEDGRMLTIPFRMIYRDASGQRYETNFIMSHCPGILGCPLMYIENSSPIPKRGAFPESTGQD